MMNFKKIFIMSLAALFIGGVSAYSLPIPTLQLDATDSMYENGNIVTTNSTFNLIALVNPKKLRRLKNYNFLISVALAPESSDKYGTFDFNGETVNAPFEFAIDFKDLSFSSIGAYNIQDGSPLRRGRLRSFVIPIDISKFATDIDLVFTLYGYKIRKNGKIKMNSMISAPFPVVASINGTGAPVSDADSPSPVPEPSTVLMLGIGLVGLGRIGLKKMRG